jgi:hypothetical protein
MEPLNVELPDWSNAPSWVNSHGFCLIEGDEAYGKWCYMGGTHPKGFSHITVRPKPLF